MSTIYDTGLGFAVIMIVAMAALREYAKNSEEGPATAEDPIDENDVRRWREHQDMVKGPLTPQNGGPPMPPLATRQLSPNSVIDLDPMEPIHIVPFSH